MNRDPSGGSQTHLDHDTSPLEEMSAFIAELGFRVSPIVDRRSGDCIELLVDIPPTWRILFEEQS